MFIECTSCHTRAQIPDSKEGAKVRCPECQHVYVARPLGSRGGARARKQDPTLYIIVGGGILLMAIFGFLYSRGERKEAPVAASAPEEVERPTERGGVGWESTLVQTAVQVHENAHGLNTVKLFSAIEFERAYAWRAATLAAPDSPVSAAEPPPDAATNETGHGEPAEPVVLPPWSDIDVAQRKEFQSELVDALTEGEYRELVADWKPYDGEVVDETDTTAIVRLRVHHRELEELPDRGIEWHFVRVDGKWKATSWERWFSPEELKEKTKRHKKTERKTLSDGSEVIEGVVREEIAYHEETPDELRQEIEGLIDVLIDSGTRPKDLTQARGRLVEIGKHAVPGLLKRMGSIPIETEENAIQLNQIHLILQDITGYLTTFDVHVAMGTTAERQDSGIKQWFGWYDRRWKLFWRKGEQAAEEVDPLWDDPEFAPRTEKERREFEKLRAEREAEKDG